MKLSDLKIKLYADGANLQQIERQAKDSRISGWTTNPTLLRNAGVKDYAAFAKEAIKIVAPRPISFEVIADTIDEMYRQANVIAGWGGNAVVKIPVTNTRGVPTSPLAKKLSEEGIRVNVTAVMAGAQILDVLVTCKNSGLTNISIFCGRCADTLYDPFHLVSMARKIIGDGPTEIIWASPREVLNVWHAELAGAHIITATPAILEKLSLCGKDLSEYSLETVTQFYSDAVQSKLIL